MSDISCLKCGEPWDSYGVFQAKHGNGDMEAGEARRFLAGEGCPCCGFGERCPSCRGMGEVEGYGSNPHREFCGRCGGTGKLVGAAGRDEEFYRSALDSTDDPDALLDVWCP